MRSEIGEGYKNLLFNMKDHKTVELGQYYITVDCTIYRVSIHVITIYEEYALICYTKYLITFYVRSDVNVKASHDAR